MRYDKIFGTHARIVKGTLKILTRKKGDQPEPKMFSRTRKKVIEMRGRGNEHEGKKKRWKGGTIEEVKGRDSRCWKRQLNDYILRETLPVIHGKRDREHFLVNERCRRLL